MSSGSYSSGWPKPERRDAAGRGSRVDPLWLVATFWLSRARCCRFDGLFGGPGHGERGGRPISDPGDAPKRTEGLGKSCLCQDRSHFLLLGGLGDGGVHCGLPVATPFPGLFRTADIKVLPACLPDPEAAGNPARHRRRSSRRPGRWRGKPPYC